MAIRLARTPGSRIVLGLGLAAVAGILSVFLSGAGHGWNTPLLVSVILWVVLPVTLYIAGQPQRSLLLGLLLIGLIADFILIRGTIAEARVLPRYVQVNGAAGIAIIAAWLAIWVLWQVLVLRALIVGHRVSSDA
jgi:hypothetical protein